MEDDEDETNGASQLIKETNSSSLPETQKLSKSPSLDEMEDEDGRIRSKERKKVKRRGMWNSIRNPFKWLKMLSDKLHWSFVLGVIFVYGVSQGLGAGLSKLSIQYYMKDDLKVEPSESQIYFGIIMIPWIIKPLWGFITDTVSILGYRRRPYFVFAGVLGGISMLLLSLYKNLPLALVLLNLMAGSAGIAIADVTIDACVTQNSISHPSLAGDMQSLCGMSSSVGSLVGFAVSGFLIHLLGPRGVFGLLSIPPGLLILVGMIMRESPVHKSTNTQVGKKLVDASKAVWATIQCREVWRPCIYMYLSLALCLNVHEGMFYWYTEAKEGPSFSQEIVGSILSIGAFGSLFGVVLYQNLLKDYPYRDLLFWTQLLYGASGMLDLMLVLRINVKIGIPDYFFIVFDEVISQLIGRIKWMPLIVLSSKLCPAGIEGTFFAMLMSIDHVGMLSSVCAGGVLLRLLKVSRTRFDNLWMAILIQNMLRIAPVGLLFLVPTTDPNANILPSEMLRSKKGEEKPENDETEMAPFVNNT
ncbi:probable folate-biopterin transporter 3 [Momordica charantia]|uniref:Probable folate-biopterin transporter 3 n=1 Tax=Momordica charantia TaxID=3673 RepID=A0A6J1DIY1_MOMCH|nr:probable folate-biopterin transporter 3 [Momordica charantia]